MQWEGRGGKLMDLEKLKDELRRDEGLRLETYHCTTGHRTIGYGHMIDKYPNLWSCTLEEAETWLDEDIKGAIRIAEIFIWPDSLHSLQEIQQRALVNMAFNLGLRLCKFKKLRIAIQERNWQQAAIEILDSLYAKQVGARANRIAKMVEMESSNAGV
jgi:lysozyme